MPKSASSTVAQALRGAVDRPAFQIHLLTPERVARSERHYRETDPDARMLTHLATGVPHRPPPDSPDTPTSTLVRDPIAQLISQFFQGSPSLDPCSDAHRGRRRWGSSCAPSFSHIAGMVRLEMKPHVGMDATSTSNHVSPTPDRSRVPELVCSSCALGEPGRGLARAWVVPGSRRDAAGENSAPTKEYAASTGPSSPRPGSPTTLDTAYSSKLVRHFYSPDEIEAFRRSWHRPEASSYTTEYRVPRRVTVSLTRHTRRQTGP